MFELSKLPFAHLPVIYKTCGEDMSCLYDVGATGSTALGRETKEVVLSYTKLQELTEPGMHRQ